MSAATGEVREWRGPPDLKSLLPGWDALCYTIIARLLKASAITPVVWDGSLLPQQGDLVPLRSRELHEVLCQLLQVRWQRQGQTLLEGVKLLPRVTAFKSSLQKSKVPTFYQKTNIISIHDGEHRRRLVFPYVDLSSPCPCWSPCY